MSKVLAKTFTTDDGEESPIGSADQIRVKFVSPTHPSANYLIIVGHSIHFCFACDEKDISIGRLRSEQYIKAFGFVSRIKYCLRLRLKTSSDIFLNKPTVQLCSLSSLVSKQ